jgi:hypothetical protein
MKPSQVHGDHTKEALFIISSLSGCGDVNRFHRQPLDTSQNKRKYGSYQTERQFRKMRLTNSPADVFTV